MNLEISYSKKANKFLQNNTKTLTEEVVDKLVIGNYVYQNR